MASDLDPIAKTFSRIELRGRSSLNPLHKFIIVAEEFSSYYQEHVLQRTPDEVDLALYEGWGKPLSDKPNSPLPPSKTIEEAGILGLYQLLNSKENQDFLYGNDLSRIVHGIDAVSKNTRSGKFLIWEVKGTTRPISGGFRSYLRKTKTMGRQLSWEWSWNRLILLACHTTTSKVFLTLVKPFIKGEVERRLVVSQVKKSMEGFNPAGANKVWAEEDFSLASEMCDTHNRETQQTWLEELETTGVQLP